MTQKFSMPSKVSSEGRVVIPAAIRSVLGVEPGDRVQFEVENGKVQLLTADSMLMAVWANNHGGDAGDSVVSVREMRVADTALVADKWARIEADVAADTRSDEEIEASLLEQFGLAP